LLSTDSPRLSVVLFAAGSVSQIVSPEYQYAYYSRGQAFQALGKTAEADFRKYEELTGEKP
jgi:hypothetical protein